MTVLLRVSGLRKSFGSLIAVDDVGFDVTEDSILGIVGPNGAGKTTLFNAITGLPFRADAGRVEFMGRRIERLPPHELPKLGIARTFQHAATFGSLSVEQNLRLAAVFGRRMTDRSARDVVSEILDFIGLRAVRGAPPSTLPLDARKRLMLGSALVTDPKILLLDEPAAGLHGPELAALHGLVLAIRERGITLLIIEHVLPVLFSLADRVLVMDAGRVIADGTPAQVSSDDVVITAYLGEHGRQAFGAARG